MGATATALEEGEACYYEDDDGDNTSIDPDVALSYIDEKIQHVLGHFQKDFEGGVSAENLGAKFGGYGSFLPTYERSPLRPHPKTPQRNHKTPRSTENLGVEDATQNCTAPSNAPLSGRLGTTSCSAKSLHNTKVPSADVTAKQDSCLLSDRIAEKSPLINETLNQSVTLTEHKKPKIRIKVSSDNKVRQNAAIYSGLGLDISPSSSLGNSPEVSEGMPPNYGETPDKSPTSILQIMTSFPVLGGSLVSPLHDSLLWLTTKERLPRNSKPGPILPASQEISAKLADGSASTMRVVNGSKGKKTGLVEKSERLEEKGIGIGFEDVITVPSKRKSAIKTSKSKKFMSKDLKFKLPSKSIFDVSASTKGAGRTDEIVREANKDELKGKSSCSDLGKEEPLGSQESCKSEKLNANHSAGGRNSESKVANYQKGVPFDFRDDGRCQSNKTSVPFDADVSKRREGPNAGATEPSKQKLGQKAASHEQNGIALSYRIGKELFESKKKSKGVQSNGKQAANVAEESSRVSLSAAPKDKNNIGCALLSKTKTHKLKSQKENHKVRDYYNDILGDTKLAQTDIGMENLKRPLGNKLKDSNLDYVEKEHIAFFDKSKEQSIGGKGDKQTVFEASLTEAPNGGLPLTENGLSSGMVPAVAASVVIEENWVGCDSCQKWRLLPYGTKPDQLPENWLCNMLNWLPGMNRCDIDEEETTKALHALYQCPVPEIQTKPPSVNGTALGVTSINGHLDENHHNPSSHSIASRGKKKYKTKDITNADSSSGSMQISNSTKNRCLESMKSRSLNGMDQNLLESSLARKHLGKSHELAIEKHESNPKEKHMNRGDVKQEKTKNKRDADQYGYGESKKIKTEGSGSDRYSNSEKVGDLGRVGLSSSTDFSTKATGKDMQKSSDVCSLKNSKSARPDRISVSIKKLGDKSQFSLDGESSDLRTCDKRDASLKKRKLENWRDSQNNTETSQSMGNLLPDSKAFQQENIGSEFRKEKKFIASKAEGKESTTNKGDDRSDKKGRATRIVLSVNRDHLVDGMEEVRGSKDCQVKKHKEKITPPIFSDGVDLLNRDLGSMHTSMETTSSSSKVSGSRGSRSKHQGVRGSPVESVSSSPLRTSNPGKVALGRVENFGKSDATNGVIPVRGTLGRCLDGEGNDEGHRLGLTRKEIDYSTLDCRERDANHKLDGKDNPSVEFRISHLVNDDVDTIGRHARSSMEHDRVNINHFCDSALIPQKSEKGLYLQYKDKVNNSTSDLDRDKMKVCNPLSEQEDLHSNTSLRNDRDIDPHHTARCNGKISSIKVRFPEKCIIKSSKDEEYHVRNKESLGNRSSKGNHLKYGEQDGSHVKLDAHCSKNGKFTPQQNLIQDTEGEKLSNGLLASKVDSVRIESEAGKSNLFPHREGKKETFCKGLRTVPVSQKGDVFKVHQVDVSADVTRESKQPENAANKNGAPYMLEHPLPNRHMIKDLNASTPVRKDPSDQTSNNALKEAKHLKDLADSLKSSGFGLESRVAHLQAALKFLLAASLLETCNSDGGSRHGEMTQIQLYSSTAKLCESCAHEYEGRQEMAAASLAYKCMEVAYMRAVYCKHFTTSRDRHELQTTLQMFPQGESPSSSASDVDNLNIQATVDKNPLSKGNGSHVAGHHVIVARNRPNFIRLLDFTQDVNLAMEASIKSQNAFAAANRILEEGHNKEGIAFVKRVVDFSFQDVEGLVRLVELAIEAISRSGYISSRD